MADVSANNLIGIDRDRPIYRTYSRKRFVDLLRSGEDGLRNPSTWEDPFENFLMERTLVSTDKPGEFGNLKTLAAAWYGQCWTTNEDTDAMWRIYSPDKGGVKACTTVGKLFDNLCSMPAFSPRLQFFVGRVSYLRRADIEAAIGSMTFTGLVTGRQGDGFAELLCVKRDAFEHEREVRILYQHVHGEAGLRYAGGTATYSLDANVVFNGVVLDPRLMDDEAETARAELSAAGWKGRMPRSELYDVPEFVIPIQ